MSMAYRKTWLSGCGDLAVHAHFVGHARQPTNDSSFRRRATPRVVRAAVVVHNGRRGRALRHGRHRSGAGRREGRGPGRVFRQARRDRREPGSPRRRGGDQLVGPVEDVARSRARTSPASGIATCTKGSASISTRRSRSAGSGPGAAGSSRPSPARCARTSRRTASSSCTATRASRPTARSASRPPTVTTRELQGASRPDRVGIAVRSIRPTSISTIPTSSTRRRSWISTSRCRGS